MVQNKIGLNGCKRNGPTTDERNHIFHSVTLHFFCFVSLLLAFVCSVCSVHAFRRCDHHQFCPFFLLRIFDHTPHIVCVISMVHSSFTEHILCSDQRIFSGNRNTFLRDFISFIHDDNNTHRTIFFFLIRFFFFILV